MTSKRLIVAALALFASAGAVPAGELLPMHAHGIDLGAMKGVAYYTVVPEGFHVVATLAESEASSPVRFEAVLASGQSLTLSTPREAGLPPVIVEISRMADRLSIQQAVATN